MTNEPMSSSACSYSFVFHSAVGQQRAAPQQLSQGCLAPHSVPHYHNMLGFERRNGKKRKRRDSKLNPSQHVGRRNKVNHPPEVNRLRTLPTAIASDLSCFVLPQHPQAFQTAFPGRNASPAWRAAVRP